MSLPSFMRSTAPTRPPSKTKPGVEAIDAKVRRPAHERSIARAKGVDRVGACVEDGHAVRSSRRELIVGIGAAVAVGAVSVLVPGSAASSTAVVLETVARAVAVGLPVAVGLMAWRRPPFERFGRLLVATGAAVLVVTLSLSDNAVLYSTGRVVHWGVEAALVYLILAFPSGGLAQRVDRALATAAVAARRAALPPDGAAGGDLPDAGPVGELQLGLSAQRVHGRGARAAASSSSS